MMFVIFYNAVSTEWPNIWTKEYSLQVAYNYILFTYAAVGKQIGAVIFWWDKNVSCQLSAQNIISWHACTHTQNILCTF